MFCDICDQFDLHETEDCPTQVNRIASGQTSQPRGIDFPFQTTPLEEQEQTHTKSRGQRGVVREYCETCEVFGHDTDDCNDGETF